MARPDFTEDVNALVEGLTTEASVPVVDQPPMYEPYPEAEVTAAVDAVDTEALITEADAMFTAEVWDGESPINGVDPDTVRNAHSIPEGGAVSLVRDTNGNVIIFQPFDPAGSPSEPVVPERAAEVAEAERQELVRGVFRSRLGQELSARLPDPTPITPQP